MSAEELPKPEASESRPPRRVVPEHARETKGPIHRLVGASVKQPLLVGVIACGLLLSALVIVPMKLRLRRLQAAAGANESVARNVP